jgi:putative component of membrane protein insertase Oxa1/YidC/SpoIIIJ protein YidD
MNSILSKIACNIIMYYQSKGGGSKLFNIDCNFEPSCSEYAKQAIQKIGLFAAIPSIISRLKRCNDPDKVERDSDPFIENQSV